MDNSYTSFKNRIGLTVDNKFIKDSKDIVLNFPFKDCYLEGGQTKDEGEEEYFYNDKDRLKSQKRKRKEIFFNEYIAYDEIDALLSKKAICNFKKYTKDGEIEFKNFNRNENGIIKDNLIIKGNNLLTLHSLYSEFKGKIKLIYIDPNEMIKNIREPKFFIFSDDIDYVKNNIIKKLSKTVLFYIVDINDNDKGYFDLFLMMNCKHQIASNGSFGYYAYCFNKNKDKILITPQILTIIEAWIKYKNYNITLKARIIIIYPDKNKKIYTAQKEYKKHLSTSDFLIRAAHNNKLEL